MKSLATKIVRIMKDVSYIQKDARNKGQGYNYVSEAGIIAKIRDAMIEHGVVAIPEVTSFLVEHAAPTKSGTAQYLTTLQIKYTLIDADSGESCEGCVVGQGMDFGDKGAYQAATGANKYFLLKTFQIATGDDPEEEGPEDDSGDGDPTEPAEDEEAIKAALIKRIGLATQTCMKEGVFTSTKHALNALKKATGAVAVTNKMTVEQLTAWVDDLKKRYREHEQENKEEGEE